MYSYVGKNSSHRDQLLLCAIATLLADEYVQCTVYICTANEMSRCYLPLHSGS